GLYQLEVLLGETFERYEQRKVTLLGTGEGGVIAMLLGLIFPDKVRAVVAIDAPFPTNIDKMPLDARPLAGLPVLVSGDSASAAHNALVARGAAVTLAQGSVTPQTVTEFLSRIG